MHCIGKNINVTKGQATWELVAFKTSRAAVAGRTVLGNVPYLTLELFSIDTYGK